MQSSHEEERREEYDDDDNVDNFLNHPQASELNNGLILVGRNQPGGMGSLFFQQMHDLRTVHGGSSSSPPTFMSSGSHIVDYLRSRQPYCSSSSSSGTAGVGSLYSFSHDMTPCAKKGQQMTYEVLIQDRLDYILMALRYVHSPSWEGIYRPQCIRASLDTKNVSHQHLNIDDAGKRRRPTFFPLWSRYQAYVERSVAMCNLLPIMHATSLSTRDGLSLELFKYNDHREGHAGCSHSYGNANVNNRGHGETEKKAGIHQHHPFSPYLLSHSGSGGVDAGGGECFPGDGVGRFVLHQSGMCFFCIFSSSA